MAGLEFSSKKAWGGGICMIATDADVDAARLDDGVDLGIDQARSIPSTSFAWSARNGAALSRAAVPPHNDPTRSAKRPALSLAVWV